MKSDDPSFEETKSRRRLPPLDANAKEWDQLFSAGRDFHEDDSSYVETLKKEFNVLSSDLEIFLRDCEGPVPLSGLEEVRELCETPLSRTDDTQDGEARSDPGKAWLDDREASTGHVREYPNRLNADQLFMCLAKKRYGLENLPNADRRLVYVADLDPDYILAIARTAPWYQVGTLRDAIWKHVALQTSIRVKILPFRFPIFRLQFQLPYLALRPIYLPACPMDSHRDLIDVSFLDIRLPERQKNRKFGIREAEISLVICGSGNKSWTAYAFVDTRLEDSGSLQDEDGAEDDDSDDDDAIDEGPPVNLDPFGDAGVDEIIDANYPTWDARAYFLRVVNIRMRQVLEEWRFLVRQTEKSVKRYGRNHRFILVQEPSAENPRDIKMALNWTVQALEVLNRLRSRLSMTMKAWDRFQSPGGDICYFSEIPGHSKRSLESIKETFQDLEDLEQTLIHLDEFCEKSSRILQLQMGAEGNRLNFESNRLNFESHQLHCQTHHLNLQTSVLSRDNHRLNLETSKIALANHEAAQMTSRTTLLSLEINQVMAPVALVLAYFGTQRDIFSFERNSKTFVICTVIMVVAVRLLAFVINGVGSAKRICGWLWIARARRTRATAQPSGDSDSGVIELSSRPNAVV